MNRNPIQSTNGTLHVKAIDLIGSKIRESTTSMTSVPKPLKFLKPHYPALVDIHKKIIDLDLQVKSTTYALV